MPDDLCCQPNFETILEWFTERGVEQMTRQVQAIWTGGRYENWRLYCFRVEAEATAFLEHFSGQRFDPKRDRENGRTQGVWRRTGEHRRVTESGPLKINPVFLRGPGNMEYD